MLLRQQLSMGQRLSTVPEDSKEGDDDVRLEGWRRIHHLSRHAGS